MKKATTNPVDDLIRDFSAPTEPFEILMPSGAVYKFKVPQTRDEQKNFEKARDEWSKKMLAASMPDPHKGLNLGHSEEALGVAYTMSALSVEPKINQIQALQLLNAPFICEYVTKQIGAHQFKITAERIEAWIEEGKKELSQTESGEPV
ncbi:MAG: hypothetical protein IT203_02590 [Fimbriimonadaceae bacterium]|nr:hypothetical protein [Fimbriimonadaceae bacterium]